MIKRYFEFSYYSRAMSYKEVKTLTPFEFQIILEKFNQIIEERNKK